MDRALIHGNDKGFLDLFLDSSTDFVIAHTSGSTGEPKPIRLKKNAMIDSAKATVHRFGLGRGSNLVCPLYADYIAGKMMIVRGLVAGADVWMLEPHRQRLLENLPAGVKSIDLLAIVPAQIQGLIESPRLGDVVNVIVGGAPTTPAQERLLADSGVNAFATYGMTETCSHVALRKIGGDDVYEAMPGVTFSLDNRNCLCVGSLTTNDIVDLVDERHFRWLGRYDNVINSGGVKLHPELIERQLAPLFPDMEFYLTSRPSEMWGREMIMVVTEGFRSGIMEKCRETLPATSVPKEIIFDSAPSYTASGKLIRRRF